MTVPMWVATSAWLLLVMGALLRKQRSLHVACMTLGILTDVSLVLYLQITRSAVQTAFFEPLTLLQYLHIGASSSALLLYLPVSIMGWLLYVRGTNPRLRYWHIRVALLAFTLRSAGWCLMFSMLSRHAQ